MLSYAPSTHLPPLSVMTLWVPLATITETMHTRVCPLYTFADNGKAHLTGSAVPLRVGDTGFLVTAAHVCFARLGQPVPLFTWGNEKPRLLAGRRGAWEYQPGAMADVDVGVLALTDEEMSDLGEAYRFVTKSQVATAKPKTPGVHYVLAGYPAARNKVTRNNLPSVATHIITGDIGDVSAFGGSDKYDGHHFSLGIPGDIIPRFGGGEFRIPKPSGMSGGGVWRIDIDISRQVATSPMLVGIGIEFHKRHHRFIATRLEAAFPLIQDFLDDVPGPIT